MKLCKELLLEADQIGVKYIQGCNIVGTYTNKITKLECPIKLSNGWYEIEEIGCFSYITSNYYCGKVKIGRFCSIGPRVIISPNLHPTQLLTHNNIFYGYGDWDPRYFDFSAKDDFIIQNRQQERISYGNKVLPVEIGNDVWIGTDSILMNGIKIGNGAVIAAGAIVTHDVPAYSIVAGNPARVLRRRFDIEDIEALEKLKWWEYGPDILKDIDLSNIKKAISMIQERTEKMDKYKPETLLLYHDTGKIEKI